MENVAGCQPVFGVYTRMHNTVCRNFLDGLVSHSLTPRDNIASNVCMLTAWCLFRMKVQQNRTANILCLFIIFMLNSVEYLYFYY